MAAEEERPAGLDVIGPNGASSKSQTSGGRVMMNRSLARLDLWLLQFQ
jgi:hypothetical protein